MNGGDTLLIPNVGGVFKINANGIRPKNGTVVQLDGTLQQVTQPNEDYCRIIMLEGTRDVVIQGLGTLRGDRDTHVGDESDFGARGSNIELREGANNILITGITTINSWADGICFAPAPTEAVRSVGVTIDGIICNDNRRNGISVIDGDTVNIKNSQFRRNGTGARATAPFLAIDLECGVTTDACLNIVIENNTFDGNSQTQWDVNISVGSPNGTYKNIYIANTNTYDLKHRPIAVSGAAGKISTPITAWIGYYLLHWLPSYRFWGWPKEWRSN